MVRSCGPCSACCTLFPIAGIPDGDGGSFDKPAGIDCKHLTEAGCGIYETRPEACRRYDCLWRLGTGRNMERPDRSGYVMNTGPRGEMLIALLPGAFAHRRDALASYGRKFRLVVMQ